MKQILLMLLVAGMAFTSCNAQTKNNKSNEINGKENKMKTIHLNKTDFLKKVANYEANPGEFKYLGDKPALIDFYADWCGPCKAIAPVLEELAAEYDGEIYIYKINTEEEQELAALFGIRNIPSLLFVPMGGEQPQMAQGALPKPNLKEAIDKVLLKK
ncbi:thioredoxin [Prevotella sp. 10(H)]|uniref:thioredoxin n=1 Tax=Prevotella sp. 10(H) TaxID=1158294 RepID=UPI0004A731D3|nr:thioredoxin [Prevotella sp. 10(H)]